MLDALDLIRFETEPITKEAFEVAIAVAEKHCLDSFSNHLFRAHHPTYKDPRAQLSDEIRAALEGDLDLESARSLLEQASEALKPQEDLDLFIPPKDDKMWERFRCGTATFYSVVTDDLPSLQST